MSGKSYKQSKMQVELKNKIVACVNPKEAIRSRFIINNGKMCTFARKAFLSLNGISRFFLLLFCHSASWDQTELHASYAIAQWNVMTPVHKCSIGVEQPQGESFNFHSLKLNRKNKNARALNLPISVYMQLKNEILIGAGIFFFFSSCALVPSCDEQNRQSLWKNLSFLRIRIIGFCVIEHSFFSSAKEKAFQLFVSQMILPFFSAFHSPSWQCMLKRQ